MAGPGPPYRAYFEDRTVLRICGHPFFQLGEPGGTDLRYKLLLQDDGNRPLLLSVDNLESVDSNHPSDIKALMKLTEIDITARTPYLLCKALTGGWQDRDAWLRIIS